MDVIFFGVERDDHDRGKIVSRYRGGCRLHATFPTVEKAKGALENYRDRHLHYIDQSDRLQNWADAVVAETSTR
jgi:hypothetical protein